MEKYPLRRITSDADPAPESKLFDPAVEKVAQQAIREVADEGEPAVRRWAARFDGLGSDEELVIVRDGMQKAYETLPPDTAALLHRARDRIEAFAQAQKASLQPATVSIPGGRAGHDIVPVSCVGCYVPGGRFPLPSSALMTVLPAKVAGVGTVYCAGPRPTAETLAAAWLAGADGFLKAGGAHGIAALAYGLKQQDGKASPSAAGWLVPPCDVIVGPGGPYVTAAKRLLFGKVGTEAPAGPSELLVIADETADPAVVAADLLAQAEHSPDAVPCFIALSEAVAEGILQQLMRQIGTLPEMNRTNAQSALAHGWYCVEAQEDLIVRLADRTAPEHLEIATREPRLLAARISNAGALFLGAGSAEVFGDYGAGPNHTLPTGGAARFAGGLSVFQFLRIRTWIAIDNPASLAGDTAAFARMEGLEAHARAAEARLLSRPAPLLEHAQNP
ncbi:MAG: histidinol dehydrogenase [Spirochaetaceae bacterium]|nr:histidinol dehydrogenase [Spirochaetaceae bacterium]